MSMTNDLETPLFERGRPDRNPINEEFFDVNKSVNVIRVRIFQEKGNFFITGIQMCYVSSPDSDKFEVLGFVDLHDYGTWKEHRMEPGD